MSASQRITGLNAKVLWVDGSGTVDASGDRRRLDLNLEQNTVEGAAGNDTATYAVPTLKSNSATLTIMHIGTAGTALLYRLREGQSGTLLAGEIGTASGSPKWGIPAVVKKQGIPVPYDDMVEVTIEFEGQGALAFDGRTATW